MKKWILRLLMVVVFLIAGGLFTLNIVSGTSETQKKGLEQAFSKIFRGTATFGKLQTFNLFPQLTIHVQNLAIIGAPGGDIAAEDAEMSFALLDVVLKNRLIQNLHFKNLRIDEGVYLPLAIFLENAGTYISDTKDSGKFAFQGTYGGQPLKGEFAMILKTGARPKFTFDTDNHFVMNVGSVQLSGIFSPYIVNGGQIKNLKLYAAKKDGQQSCEIAEDKIFGGGVFFRDILTQAAKVKNAADFMTACGKVKAIASASPASVETPSPVAAP